jgi:hypothetical protein
MKGVIVANLGVTFALVGLIWTIQLVHYPLFARVGAEAWARYHAEHTARITLLVGPLMCAEVACAAWLVAVAPAQHRVLAWVAAACVAVAWMDTGLRAVPLHGRLGAGLDVALVGALVRVNLLRTLAWTLRGELLVRMALSGSGA